MLKPLSSILSVPGLQGQCAVRGNLEGLSVDSLTDDSRRAGARTLFSVTPEGEPFVDAAYRNGCRTFLVSQSMPLSLPDDCVVLITDNLLVVQGLIASEIYDRPVDSLYMVGITGTNGKTSMAMMLYHIWRTAGLRPGIIGTLGITYINQNGETVERKTGYTTPRAGDLHAILDEMRRAGVTHVAMEVSSEGISLGRVYGCRFDAAVFTNLTPEHLDFHQNMESYFQTKLELFRMATGRIIVYSGSEYGKRAIVCGEEIAPGRVVAIDRPSVSDLPVPTSFNCLNGTLAVLASSPDPEFQRGAIQALATLPSIPGRFTIVPSGQNDHFGIIDYAHTPDALAVVLEEARQLGVENLAVVFGCGGDRDPQKRPLMGAIAESHADLAIVTDDNPRTESPAAIRRAIIGAFSPGANYLEIGDRSRAILRGAEWLAAQKGRSALVVAGKGHETVQIFADRREPFSDLATLEHSFKIVHEGIQVV